ncbi:MAG TPA: M13-type metalloendopeptidase [Woeseiaceae bacterium]|nr:M13-type metalloendopeptidase [Woeseiaceae bacterium]
MRNSLMTAAAMVALTACGQQDAPTTAAEPALALESGIALEYMDTSISPGDDFFSYVNGKWIAETEIPADKASYGGFGILADEAQADVRAIIEASASGDYAEGTDEQKVGDLYTSYLDMDTRNAKGVTPLEPELERIEAITDHDELAVYFASANRRGYPVPVNIGQVADLKDPEHYMIYAWQNGLGLPDREYYFNGDETSAGIREKYVEHIATMFDLAGFENGDAAAKTIMDLETRLAGVHITKEAARDWPNNYNKVPLDELGEVMPAFNWQGFTEEAGVADIGSLVLMMTSYFEGLDPIIAETDIDTWKTYLRWVALNSRANALNDAIDKQDFEFYGRTLTGAEEQRAPWRRAVTTVNGLLGELVGKVYVKEHFPPEAKERMVELVGNLIKAYDKSIRELDWMSDETKAQALDKLSKFTAKIGYPDEWRDYSAIEIRADDLFGNIERATVAEYERELARQGGPVDRTEWGMTPQTVNAYYMPPLNEIVFPAAILQPPFFNLEADDAVNYGAIGAVIGHEIGHGFDDKGSTFDGDGVMRNWWTEADRAEFERRTARLVEQYNEYAPFDDLSVNGEFTLGENIGDLGGISIGLLAYKMSLDGEEPPVIDGFTGIQRVFLGYAQVWRNKYRDEALRQLIMTNPHAPSMYRANGAVRNVPEFYEAFGVAEGDGLYLPPEERVKIW